MNLDHCPRCGERVRRYGDVGLVRMFCMNQLCRFDTKAFVPKHGPPPEAAPSEPLLSDHLRLIGDQLAAEAKLASAEALAGFGKHWITPSGSSWADAGWQPVSHPGDKVVIPAISARRPAWERNLVQERARELRDVILLDADKQMAFGIARSSCPVGSIPVPSPQGERRFRVNVHTHNLEISENGSPYQRVDDFLDSQLAYVERLFPIGSLWKQPSSTRVWKVDRYVATNDEPDKPIKVAFVSSAIPEANAPERQCISRASAILDVNHFERVWTP